MIAPALSVVLPLANQSDHVTPWVERYHRELQTLCEPFEILLVVNGSKDGTKDQCRRLEAAYPEVRLLESRPGWGHAVRTGVDEAQGRLICYTNSARTDPADLVLTIRYALVNEAVVVKASRKLRDSLVRRLGSVLYNFEVRMLFGLAVWDVNGTPKVFPRALVAQLGLTEGGDLIDCEFLVNCKRHRIPVVEVPVYSAHRHGGRSTTTLKSAVRMYLGALRLYRRLRARDVRTAAPTQTEEVR